MKEYVVIAPEKYAGKVNADFNCTGKNDELIIQSAIEKAIETNSNIMLLNGVYYIDGFNNYYNDDGPDAAICFPNKWREIKFVGENAEYGFQKRFNNGVVLYVSAAALKKSKKRNRRTSRSVDRERYSKRLIIIYGKHCCCSGR